MLSYALMRLECAVRNATVIGVVGGGGLGAELFDELGYGHNERVVTLLLLLLLLALTVTTDVFSNFLRRQLQDAPNHPHATRALDLAAVRRRRTLALGSVAAAVLASALWLAPAFTRAGGELERIEWGWIGAQLRRLARPDLAPATLLEALRETRVPLALGLLGTLGGVAVAVLLVWPSSVAFQLEPQRFTGERVSGVRRLVRLACVAAARVTTLVLRSVPEVAWVLILASFFTLGALPGVLAMALHSAGVLGRVYVEAVDNVACRRLEPALAGSRLGAFLYAALPESRRDWTTYALFQLEVNVRMGLVFGILGVGGLGDRFHSSLSHQSLERASTLLLAMLLLSVAIDRLSRASGLAGVRCR